MKATNLNFKNMQGKELTRMGVDNFLKLCVKTAKEKKCIFLADVFRRVDVSHSTFYDYFPSGSDGHKAVVAEIKKNRIGMKTAMQKKWFESDSAALQIALYKLICSESEAQRLNGSRQVITGSGQGGAVNIEINDLRKAPDSEIIKVLQQKLLSENNG